MLTLKAGEDIKNSRINAAFSAYLQGFGSGKSFGQVIDSLGLGERKRKKSKEEIEQEVNDVLEIHKYVLQRFAKGGKRVV